MTERIRLAILLLGAILILALINVQISGKEAIVRDGRTVLLRLAPIDPRSLIQGDYMALRYAMSDEVASAARNAGLSDGIALVRVDEAGEAAFVGLYEGQQLAGDEALLGFRRRGDSVRLASDAYFFEEGEWETYEAARFGELRVGSNGDAVLTGLRDEQRRLLGTELHDFSR